ncbi:hypothetical protein [Clostridium sp.]
MKVPYRIGIELLDDNLKSLINASTKIFPILQTDLDGNLNPNNYEFGKLKNLTDNITYIYIWDGAWKVIGADDKSVDWTNDVKNKPSTFTPSTHNHVKSDITDFPTLSTVATSGSYVDLSSKPTIPTNTNQLTKTDVYTKTEVNASLSGKSDTTHNHDGRYNTVAENTSLLSGKSDTNHNHDGNYAVKSIETTVSGHTTLLGTHTSNIATNTSDILGISNNMANGDMHSNIGILNQLTQGLLDLWNNAVTHISDAVKHITGAERTLWNTVSGKAATSHTHVATAINLDATHRFTTDTEKTLWNTVSSKADATATTNSLANKVDISTFNGHTGNTTVHVLQTDKDGWNAKALQGEIGLTGAKGDTGSQGIQGIQGVQGTTTTVNLITITNTMPAQGCWIHD